MAKKKKEQLEVPKGIEQEKALEIVKSAIIKQFGVGSVIHGTDPIPGVEFLSSGCLSLDEALGGGWAKGRMIEIFGPASSGKSQPLDSKILTPTGFVSMKDIKVGSIICVPDGTNTTVTGIFPQGKQKIYKVTFNDQRITYCTGDHLWSLIDSDKPLTTKQILTDRQKPNGNLRECFVKRILPLQFNGKEKNLPIDPYLLGVYLAIGTIESSIVIFNSDNTFIINKIRLILNKVYPNSILRNSGDSISIKQNSDLSDELKRINRDIESSKFIPKRYLHSGIKQRKELLKGFIDSIGIIDKAASISFCTKDIIIVNDVQYLARSLGYMSNITKKNYIYSDPLDRSIAYKLYIYIEHGDTISFSIFKDKKELDKYFSKFLDSQSKIDIHDSIISIELTKEEKECQCISVNHPDHLYITDDFIVTHNTTVTLHTIANIQKNGGTAAFIDAEHAFDPSYASSLGVDTSKLLFSQPNNGEQALDITEMMVRSGALDLIIIDSVAALVPQKEIEGNMGDSVMGLQARLMSQAMRKLDGVAHKTNTTIMWINQIRMKIGVMWGSPETTSGGNALKFYSSQRVDIRRIGRVKDGDQLIANITRVKVVKNKVGPPFLTTEFEIVYGKGIDILLDVIDLAIKKNIIIKAGSWYSYNDKQIGQGTKLVRKYLLDNPDIFDEIKKQII